MEDICISVSVALLVNDVLSYDDNLGESPFGG